MKLFISFICVFLFSRNVSTANQLKCDSPDNCRFEPIYKSHLHSELQESQDTFLLCDINNDAFEIRFKEATASKTCDSFNSTIFALQFAFRWTTNDLAILDKRFNISNVFEYISKYGKRSKFITLLDLKGFDVDFFSDEHSYDTLLNGGLSIEIINGRLDFYHNKRKVKSCQDIIDLNITRIRSIFQIKTNKYYKYFSLIQLEYKHDICPHLFQNTNAGLLTLHDLVDTFYKKNVLSFSNETYPQLNSNIEELAVTSAENINLDLNIVHPSVFNNTSTISINEGCLLKSIDGEIFLHLKYLSSIQIGPSVFRKVNHKQGIKWIRKINNRTHVNLSNITETTKQIVYIDLSTSIDIIQIFPDEDFCIYVDFPFDQLVIIDFYNFQYDFEHGFCCTYLWLLQFTEYYLTYLIKLDYYVHKRLNKLFKSAFFKSMSKCNFEERKRLCNKSNYQIKDILDEKDLFILNQKIQIPFKILLYPVSFFGLITNIIVVLVILKKENSDLFKEYKQYSYMYLNSICCVIISVIELLSWMSECFYPFEVFCPEIRKQVAIQFFKIIFKECLVTMLRFMLNFTYVAFALNRISLIGKDHGKLVTFISKIVVKKYIVITCLISISLSWIKYFKYEINYFYSYFDFPISKEMDIITKSRITSIFADFYFTFNSISDLINYLVFVVICIIIDVCMVVQLRRILNEKSKKSESLNQKLIETKKAENEEVVNKAIKMVVLNSTIGVLFKLPVCIIPLINVCAQFYYKTWGNRILNSAHPFNILYSNLIDSGFYTLIQDVSHLFFTLSLSMQIFIYHRFDKKFRTGYERLMNKDNKSKQTK